MKQTNKLLPELRFPEFFNDGEWVEKKIGDILLSESSTIALNKLDIKQNGYPVYGADSIVGFIDSYQQKDRYVSIVKDGSGVGRLNLCQEKSSILGTLSYLKSRDIEKYNLVWSYYLLNTIDFSVYVKGAGIPHIYYSDFKEEEVYVPKSNEQKKIAECLSSLDELITVHTDKLEVLKSHKKGLSQNLFPQEEQKVPTYRFPEFVSHGEWEDITVEDLIDKNILYAPKDGNHGNIHPKSSDYVKEGIPFIMASDINNGRINLKKCAFLKKAQADSLQKGFSNFGDVLITHKGTVGEVAINNAKEYPYLMLSPQVTYYRVKNEKKLYNEFLAMFFISNSFQEQLSNLSGGGTRAYVGITEQKKLIIKKPANIKEQQKIADCLMKIDNLITSQTEKIEQLKTHKKGLMQGLFPKVNV